MRKNYCEETKAERIVKGATTALWIVGIGAVGFLVGELLAAL